MVSSIESQGDPRGSSAMLQSGFVDRWIFVFMAALFVVTALAGFVPASIMKINAIAAGTRPPLTPMLHAHAVLMGSWLLLLLLQSTLVATGRRAFHKQLGMISLILAPAIVITGVILVPATLQTLWNNFENMPPAVVENIRYNVTGLFAYQIRMGVLFSIMVGLALLARRSDPQLHKRYMILATVVPLAAGFDRLIGLAGFPAFENVAKLYLDVYVLVWITPMFVWDIIRSRRIHRAYVIWGTLFVLTAIPVNLVAGETWWIEAAERILGLVP